MKRALIISSCAETDTIQSVLRSEGFGLISSVPSGSAARRFIKSQTEPEIVIINSPLSDEFGHELAQTAAEILSAGIIMICSSDIADELGDKLSDTGVYAVSRPVNRQKLKEAIRHVSAARLRLSGTKRENSSILAKIDEMRLINRAKTTLMQYLGFTEPQAHRYIEKQAMNNRQTRREAALKILATYDK